MIQLRSAGSVNGAKKCERISTITDEAAGV